MELTRKIARLVMSSISDRPGDDMSEQYHRLRRDVVELGAGGYIIFGGNVDSTAQLTHELAEEARQPLLVASDLERGLGQQLDGGTVFPTQMSVGATGIPDLAFAQGWATAREALSVGIDLVFSPVADVASEPRNPIIGIRAFGGDPASVGAMTSAFVRGCQHAGAAATAKHFPGHGDTSMDSHIELPTVTADREKLETRELVPFRAAIDAGTRAIMTAHVAYPALTGGNVPATLSREIMTDLLRGEMGFEGVLVTDALLMGAIAERYGCGEAAVMAIEAGVDILLMPPDVEEAIAAVRAAVGDGRVSEARIDESLERVETLHRWLGDYRPEDGNHVEFPPEIAGAFGSYELPDDNHRVSFGNGHEAAAVNIARKAMTLLMDEGGCVPLNAEKLDASRVAVYTLKDSDRPMNLVWFRSRLESALPGVRNNEVDEKTPPDDIERMAREAASADVTIVAVFDDVVAWKGRSGPSEALLGAARRFLEAAPDAVVLAFTGPEIALELRNARTLMCCYDGSEPSQGAAVDALFGSVPLTGRLPSDILPLFKAGSGLDRA